MQTLSVTLADTPRYQATLPGAQGALYWRTLLTSMLASANAICIGLRFRWAISLNPLIGFQLDRAAARRRQSSGHPGARAGRVPRVDAAAYVFVGSAQSAAAGVTMSPACSRRRQVLVRLHVPRWSAAANRESPRKAFIRGSCGP
jgi:hypothetical protein